jgi:kinetochore protein Mis12/MTW1
MGFEPYNVLLDIANHARLAIYPTVSSVEGWAGSIAAGRPDFDAEVERGSHAFESLLENVIDRAFDKYTAYALRNAFGVPDGVELVLVRTLAKGADASRGRRAWTLGARSS